MRRLLVKDLKAVGGLWLAGLIINALFVLVFVEINLAFLIVQVLLTFLLSIVQPAVEDRFGVAPFVNSLPVSRSEVVGAQYVGTGLLILAGLGMLIAVPLALGALVPSSGITASVWLKAGGVLSFLVPVVLLEALFLPLYFRLGLGRGIWAFLFALFGLVLVASGAAKVISLLTGRSLSGIFPVDRGMFVVPYKPLLPLAGRLKETLGPAGLAAAGLLVLTALVGLSLRLSVRFYERREF